MTDEETTDGRKLARQAQKKMRPDLPTGEGSKLAEAMGYSIHHADPTPAIVIIDESAPWTPTDADQAALRKRVADDRAAWLEERRTGLGASDIATLMGWGFVDQSLWRLWAEKVGLIPAGDDTVREEFEFGHRAEGMLADWFHDKTGLYVSGSQELRRHPEHEWMIATIDGEVFESHGVPYSVENMKAIDRHKPIDRGEPLGGVEFKTTGDPPGVWEAAVPDRYVAQAQWQMAVCGWERVWFAVLHGRRFRVHGPVERDEADIALLMEAGRKFWFSNVLTGIPPVIDDSEATGKALNEAYRGNAGETVDLSAHAADLQRLRNLKALSKRTEDEMQLIENKLKSLMVEATEGVVGDKVLLTWRPFERTQIDTEMLKGQYPAVYADVAKRKPQRAFRLVPEKEEK